MGFGCRTPEITAAAGCDFPSSLTRPAARWISLFWHSFVLVLVLSIAVLVLDSILRHGLGPLDQPSEQVDSCPLEIWQCVRKRNVFYRKTINVESFMIEDRFVHQSPFEYEYEYRFTEYEYDEDRIALMPERQR